MELHDRLKAAREDADLTQAQVAEQTGIARRQYIRYEQGAQEMGIAYFWLHPKIATFAHPQT